MIKLKMMRQWSCNWDSHAHVTYTSVVRDYKMCFPPQCGQYELASWCLLPVWVGTHCCHWPRVSTSGFVSSYTIPQVLLKLLPTQWSTYFFSLCVMRLQSRAVYHILLCRGILYNLLQATHEASERRDLSATNSLHPSYTVKITSPGIPSHPA